MRYAQAMLSDLKAKNRAWATAKVAADPGFFQRLVAAGKKPLVALTALMRKIIVIANAKLRDQIAYN